MTSEMMRADCKRVSRKMQAKLQLSSTLIVPIIFLLQNTPDEHPDKPGLIKAIEVMTIAANDVNEFKRRKELGVNCEIN